MEAAGKAHELDLLGVQAEQARDPGRELRDDVGMAPRVGVARVDGVGEARGGSQAGVAVGRVTEAGELGEVSEVWMVRAHAALSVLLGEVQRLVGDRNDLRPVEPELRVRDDAGREPDGEPRRSLEEAHAADDPVATDRASRSSRPGEERELVAADTKRLAVLAQPPRHL